ncbi:hypothetical protein APV28_2649 [Comamonas testosteroni]|nr:hypothetical protein APV28_2649 [Comamonas testosteroni]
MILGLVLLESARISIDEIRDEVVTNYACLNIKRKPAAESAGGLPLRSCRLWHAPDLKVLWHLRLITLLSTFLHQESVSVCNIRACVCTGQFRKF